MPRRDEPRAAGRGGPVGQRRQRGQRGQATVYVLTMMILLTTLALGCAGFAGLAVAKHRATAAADLAALAGASTPAGGCDVAASTAVRNGARLAECARHGADVTVTVVVWAEAPFGLRQRVQARARAGPAR